MKKELQEFKNSIKSDNLLLPSLQRYVLKKSAESRDTSVRRSDIMHPSDMCRKDWCHRKDFYRITLGKRSDGGTTFNRELIFAEGNAIHSKFQDWMGEMGILYGKWTCLRCKGYWFDTSPEACPECQYKDISYSEIPLENVDYMIAGHADGAVIDGKGWFDVDEPFLIEIKSIGMGTVRSESPVIYGNYVEKSLSLDAVWTSIKRPFSSHLRQATLYCWLSDFRKMVFLYECKWNQSVKEFVVIPNFDHIADIVQKAKEVADGVRSSKAPQRPDWANISSKTCNQCPYFGECWEIDHGNTSNKEAGSPPVISVRRGTSANRRKVLRTS